MTEPPIHAGEKAARALRHELSLGFGPLRSIWETISARGVAWSIHDFGPDGGAGLYLWSDPTAIIVVNGNMRHSHQRFTAAHELGHHELHRFAGRSVAVVDKTIWGKDPNEVAANAFAAYLMAPTEGLHERFGNKRRRTMAVEDVVEAMMHWGLSYKAMVYRLHNTQIITAATRDELLRDGQGRIDILLRHYGAADDAPTPGFSRRPPDFLRAAMTLYQQSVVTDSRLGQLLDLPVEQAVAEAREAGFAPTDPDDIDILDNDLDDLFQDA